MIQRRPMKQPIAYIIFVICASLGWAGKSAPSIAEIISQPHQKNASFSILAVDAQSGKVLYALNETVGRIPASNMKLVTSAAALHYLGPEYVFRTEARWLDNDLMVIGGGDPVLADAATDQRKDRPTGWFLQQIVDALTQRQIKQIRNVLLDPYFFDANRSHPSWPADQLNQWYACEVSGLNYNGNCVRIFVSRKNGSVALTMEPQNDFVELINQIKIAERGATAVGGYRTNVPNRIIVRGTLNQAGSFDLAIEHPSGLLGYLLAGALNNAGIQRTGDIIERHIENRSSGELLYVAENTIWDVLYRCNKDSFGLAAEALVKTVSAERTEGRINGEWEHGLGLVADYLRSLGIDNSQFILDDGSGLSRKNRLTCRILVAVLRDMYQKPYGKQFFQTLAQGGLDGTVSKFFRTPPYRGNIWGKTGYIANVRSFSGLCQTPRGDILFSILTEGGNAMTRQCINEITESIFDGRF